MTEVNPPTTADGPGRRCWALVVVAAMSVSCSAQESETSTVSPATRADGTCLDTGVAMSASDDALEAADVSSSLPRLDLQSGGLTVGNFNAIGSSGRQGTPGFEASLYWVPSIEDLARSEPLTIEVRHVEDRGASPTSLTVEDYSHSGSVGYFWMSTIPLPAPGRWQLTGTAGPLTGCFEFEVTLT